MDSPFFSGATTKSGASSMAVNTLTKSPTMALSSYTTWRISRFSRTVRNIFV